MHFSHITFSPGSRTRSCAKMDARWCTISVCVREGIPYSSTRRPPPLSTSLRVYHTVAYNTHTCMPSITMFVVPWWWLCALWIFACLRRNVRVFSHTQHIFVCVIHSRTWQEGSCGHTHTQTQCAHEMLSKAHRRHVVYRREHAQVAHHLRTLQLRRCARKRTSSEMGQHTHRQRRRRRRRQRCYYTVSDVNYSRARSLWVEHNNSNLTPHHNTILLSTAIRVRNNLYTHTNAHLNG